MIISKDLFIFGEQIFATIIPEIGTPNSTTSTPPITPTSPVVVINEQIQLQQQLQLQQQQKLNPPINFNAIAEAALKVAAKTAVTATPSAPAPTSASASVSTSTSTPASALTTKVKATEQVCLKATSKTGTIKANATTKATTTTTTTTLVPITQRMFETVASATRKQVQLKEPLAFQKTPIKNQNIPKLKKKIEYQQQQRQTEQIFENQKDIFLQKKPVETGVKEKQKEKEKEDEEIKTKAETLKLKQQSQRQEQQKFSCCFNEDQQIEVEAEAEEETEADIETEPLVKKNTIKIIDSATTTTTTSTSTPVTTNNYSTLQKQEELKEEEKEEEVEKKDTLKFLLGTQLETSQQLQQQQYKQQHQQQQQQQKQQEKYQQFQPDFYQPNIRQKLECRIQLEEPESLDKKTPTTPTTDKACLSSSITTTKTMGKVILGNNSSSGVGVGVGVGVGIGVGIGNNTTTARNDHAMVTFPFLPDHHRTLQLTFQNITVLHGNERKILSDVSGLVSPGEVLAIMGPSGSGKTTLLDCISGQRRVDSGSIYLNREQISKKWRRKICYVLQEEVFFSGLTLRETVMYTALLRLPEKMPKSEKIKLVDRLLQTLELSCCQQTKFGDYLNRGLSGGEKKRANIACELLTNPLLMLLDEPTSGLDSHSAISLMKVLKRYAIQEQKTVVITVHQPSSQMFHMFDKLLLLYNGRTAYFGEVNNIYRYFEEIGVAIKPHYNPADFVLEQLKSYPDIREKLFIAAKESHGNFLNSNCITYNSTKNSNQQISAQHHIQHHNTDGCITGGNLTITTTNGNSDKSQKCDALINDIINKYYKDISANNHHHHHNHSHINHDSPMLIIGDNSDNHHHNDNCEDAAQQLWFANADSQSNFSSTSSDYQQYETGDDWLDYPTRFHTQFRVLLSRNFKEAKPMMLSKLNWFQTIGLALMAGAIWFQLPRTEEFLHDLQGWMFFSQTYWMLFALFGALNSFPSEREVISKERRSGAYRLSAYYLAKMFGELPLVITLPTVYLIISYPMLGCASFKLFFLMLIFLLLNTIVAQSVGFFIGACCMDMNVSITLSALYTLATQLFGGYLSSRIPEGLSWIRYTSMIHYAYQNMQILEFREGPAIRCGNPSSFEICKSNETSFIPYEEILKAQSSNSPLWLNTLVLMMFFLVFRVLGYAVLRFIRCPKT